MYKLKGTIKTVKETVQVTEKFAKREFVVTDENETYPQPISFQAAQANCTILDGFKIGDSVEISFNLKGYEWTSPKDGEVKYFNTLDAWRIEKAEGETITEQYSGKTETAKDGSQDLPF